MEDAGANEQITNPAIRLIRLIDSAVTRHGGIPAARAWAEVFGLPPECEHDPHEVVARLGLVRDEIDLLDKMMRQTRFSPSLYEPALNRVRQMISVSSLASQWSNYNASVQEEHKVALRFCAEIINGDEEIPHEDLQSVLDKVHEFRAEIEEGNVPEPARTFILHQLSLIEKGIQEYPINGNRAVRSAFKNAVAEASVVEEGAVSQAPEELSKMASLWKAFQSTCKGVTETEKVVKALVGLLESAPKLIDAVSKALPG